MIHMTLNEVFSVLVSLLVFPGLLFIVSLAFFTEWFIRKFSARIQNRMGPTYVGPFGILQPFMDFIKLAGVKEEIKQKYSIDWLAKVFGYMGLSAAITALTLFPLSPVRFTSNYDFLVYIYLCCVWVPVAIIVMGLSTSNPFATIGVSRMLSIVTVCEPAYFIAILTPILLVTKLYSPDNVYSIYWTSVYSYRLWLNPYTLAPMVLGFIAIIVSLQAKSMLQPFNIPEAEQEIIAGFATEFNSQLLALSNLLHDVDTAVAIISIVYLFLGGPYPFPHLSIEGVLILVLKYLLVLAIVTIVKGVFGRFKIEQAISVMAKYSLIPALLALIMALIIPV